jgi:hypothetical protein
MFLILFLLNSWHLVYTSVFFTFLTCACFSQISVMSFIVILFPSPNDETGCRMFKICFLHTGFYLLIETSSFWRARVRRFTIPHPLEDGDRSNLRNVVVFCKISTYKTINRVQRKPNSSVLCHKYICRSRRIAPHFLTLALRWR